MANEIRQRTVKYIDWNVDMKSCSELVSKTFPVQNRQCHLELKRHSTSVDDKISSFSLYLKSSGVLQDSARVTVSVFSNSQILGSSCTTLFHGVNKEIWKYDKPLGKFFLSVSINADLPKGNKCIQTVSHLDTDIAKDVFKLMSDGLCADVKIKCGEESHMAHKIVLCARSDVFRTMLERKRRIGEIEIQGMDPRYFQDFVRYLYTDEMPELTFEKAAILYETSFKYDIRNLMLHCSKYLQRNLSYENAFQCFELADSNSDQEMKDRIITYILDEKLFLEDEYWSPFREKFPKVAIEIYRLSYKKVKKNEDGNSPRYMSSSLPSTSNYKPISSIYSSSPTETDRSSLERSPSSSPTDTKE